MLLWVNMGISRKSVISKVIKWCPDPADDVLLWSYSYKLICKYVRR